MAHGPQGSVSPRRSPCKARSSHGHLKWGVLGALMVVGFLSVSRGSLACLRLNVEAEVKFGRGWSRKAVSSQPFNPAAQSAQVSLHRGAVVSHSGIAYTQKGPERVRSYWLISWQGCHFHSNQGRCEELPRALSSILGPWLGQALGK